jgi:hypothetical protein
MTRNLSSIFDFMTVYDINPQKSEIGFLLELCRFFGVMFVWGN